MAENAINESKERRKTMAINTIDSKEKRVGRKNFINPIVKSSTPK